MRVLVFLSLVQVAGASPQTPEQIRAEARGAEVRFERLSRGMAPFRFSGGGGYDCDEIVGRFCLRFDGGHTPETPPEADAVIDARREAIEALRRAFGVAPADYEIVTPLVRYLVEDGRPREAASTARTFRALSPDSVWGRLLVAFALHAAADDTAATRLFDEAIERLPRGEWRRVNRMEWLLSHADEDLYLDADSAGRAMLADMIWVASDPLYLTPGNERWNQHVARYVWSRMLQDAPMVPESMRWGEDLDELTSRYGPPVGKSRSPGIGLDRGSLVEHYDPDQLAFVPRDYLDAGFQPVPPPGDDWPLSEERSRSGFAPATIRKLVPLEHQVTRYPVGDSIELRVDALLALDSSAVRRAPESIQSALYLVDPSGFVRDTAMTRTAVFRDTARFSFELSYPRGAGWAYSAEALEPTTGYAARARYALPVDWADDGAAPSLLVSDPLVARPFGTGRLPAGREDRALRPHASLVMLPEDTIGLYAEVRGLTASPGGRTRFAVRLSLSRLERRSIPGQMLSWLGRRLGLSSPDSPPRLEWTGEGAANAIEVLAVDLQVGSRPGLYALELEVTDLASGASATTRRLLLVEASRRRP